jgi:hypothetical protein
MKKNCFTLTLIVALAFILAALPALAQRPGGGFGQRARAQSATAPDQLAQLKRALQAAGATALTSAQESSINTLITDFRASHTPQPPSSAVQAAHSAYDTAILNQQYDSTSAQVIVDDTTANAAARLKDGASFAISVVQVLTTEQVKPLVTKFGAGRVVQLLQSLAGGRGPGAGMRRGGMGMIPPAIR